MVKKSWVPPDGGYGWIIFITTILSHVCCTPVTYQSGLLFKDFFSTLELSHFEASTILTTAFALSKIVSLFSDELIEKFTYRKVALTSSFLVTIGLVLTATSKYFFDFFIYFSLICSIGIGLSASPFDTALRAYFIRKHHRIFALAFALKGLAPVLIPTLLVFLLNRWSGRDSILLVAAMITHTIPLALLLHPVKWHLKEIFEEVEMGPVVEEASRNVWYDVFRMKSKDGEGAESETSSEFDVTEDLGKIYGYKSELPGSTYSLHPNVKNAFLEALANERTENPTAIFEEFPKSNIGIFGKVAKKLRVASWKNPIFWSVFQAMILSNFFEAFILLFLPLILIELGLSNTYAALCLSTVAIAEVIFNLISPYLKGSYCRINYAVSIVLQIVSAVCLLLFEDFLMLLMVSIFLGISKGLANFYGRLISMMENAPSPDLLMLTFAIFLLVLGPIFGAVTDLTGNYYAILTILICFSSSSLLVWLIELFIEFKDERSLMFWLKF